MVDGQRRLGRAVRGGGIPPGSAVDGGRDRRATGHEALLGQLGEVSEWVFADDADSEQIAERFTRFTAMLLLLGKEGNELFATLVEEALTPRCDGADPRRFARRS